MKLRFGMSMSLVGQISPAARAGAAYASASVATVSCALSPLGLGTTHSSAPASVSGWRPEDAPGAPEGRAVRRDAGDRDHPRRRTAHQLLEPPAALAQLVGGELDGARAWPGGRGW